MIENVKPTDRFICDLNLHQIDFDEQKKAALRKQISEKYNIPISHVEIRQKPIVISDTGERISLASNIISDIRDPKFHIELYKEYFNQKEIKDVDIKDIEEIDREVNAFIDFDLYSKYKSYKIKYLKWDNYLSYGKDNYFDFTKLNGLVLLNGNPGNQCGKTTFAINLLRFALFGKAEKSPTLDSVFNEFLKEETEVKVEAGIEIDGVDYVIRRTITRPTLKKRTEKSKSKQTVEYFRLVNGNYEEMENQCDENSAQTNNVIKESIGNIEDFDLVISATAYSLGNLLRMGQTDKGKLFSRWLGLVTLEQKDEIAKELWKKRINPTLKSNLYNKGTLEDEIKNFKICIEDYTKGIIDEEKQQNVNEANIKTYEDEKKNVLMAKKEIKEELIKTDIHTVESKLNKLINDESIKQTEIQRQRDIYVTNKNAVFDIDLKNNKLNEINIINGKLGELRAEYKFLNDEIKRINDLIAKGVCPTCNHPIELSEQSEFINQKEARKVDIEKEGNVLKEQMNKLKQEIDVLDGEKIKVDERNRAELKGSALKAEISTINLQIEQIRRQLNDIEVNKENIRINNEIDNKIRVIDTNISTETRLKEGHIRNIQSFKNDIKNYENEIKKREDVIKTLIEEEKIIRNWTIYKELVSPNGVVKIVLKKALPIINNEVERLLSGLCDFKVVLELTADNKVKLNMIHDGVSMDLGIAASGFESTMASIALRSALASVSSLPCPSMCVYDEVIGTVDVSNYESIKELYNRVASSLDFMIHITHDESTYEWHNQTITVTKENNVSKILLN